MKISRASRRFHDPWGSSKYGNRHGSVCRWQYLVGYEQLDDDDSGGDINSKRWRFDYAAEREHNAERFVRTNKHGVEKLRR